MKPFHWPRGFKYQLDEAWKHETYSGKDKDKVWYQQIICKCGGFICLHSLDEDYPILKFWSPSARITAKKIYSEYSFTMGIDTAFDGHEVVLYFPAHILKEVAPLLGARRRRQLSQEHKEKLAEAGKKHRFKSSKAGAKDSSTAQDG